MTREGGRPPAADCNLLWALSGGICAFPDCEKQLVIASGGDRWVTVGEIAHIHSHSPGGPRFDSALNKRQADSYENCLLLCREHHKIVDDNPNEYPPNSLREWKQDREGLSRQSVDALLHGALASPVPVAHNYVPRHAIDEQLCALLENDSRVALTGISGSGKSQTASHFLVTTSNRYSFRWWARATNRSLLESDLVAIGSYVGVRGAAAEPLSSVARRVARALEKEQGWLLVIDDAADIGSIRDLLPTSGGHIIITTQNAGWFGYGAVLAIPPFPLDESRTLLRSAPSAHVATDVVLDQIGNLCAGHPLALAQAASYIAASGATAEIYEGLLRQRRAELLARGEGGSHPTLKASVEMTLAKVSADGRHLLEMQSMLAPSPFPIIAAQLPEEQIWDLLADPLRLEDALAELRSFSLVERAGDSVAIHELVQDIVRARMSQREQAIALDRALTATWLQIPERTSHAPNWPVMERLLPHLLILVERLEAFTVEAQGYAARLLNRIGPYYEARGQGERAERLLRKALELAGEDHGSDTHTLRGSILTNLGNIQRDRGELVIAGQTFAEALALKELALGRNHLLTAISCSALATVAEALGNTEEARELYQRGLDVYREVDDRPRAADALLDLARLMVTTAGATDEHLTLIQEAIAALDGIDDGWAEAVTARMDLARHYEMRSDLPNAARAARDAVRIARLQAPESIELAKALSTHGEILSQLGIQPDGFRLLHRAIEMFERVESPNHVDAARMRGNLGWALYRVGDISHAFRYLKQSEEVISGLLPGGHHSVAMARYMLANGLAAMGRFDQAVELARTAIADAVRPQDLQLLQTLLADLEDSINRINAQSP